MKIILLSLLAIGVAAAVAGCMKLTAHKCCCEDSCISDCDENCECCNGECDCGPCTCECCQ